MIIVNLCTFLTLYSSVFVSQSASRCSFNTSESWVVLSSIEHRIKTKIEAVGVPLKDWEIYIYRGILTGYNEAFIIDGKKKDELIASDAKSAEIIRPILRGRDIKKYGYDYANLWLINTHNGIKEKGVKPININDYPAIKDHLDLCFPQLRKRADKGDTPYNLRNCAYMEDFYKQKIIYPEITKFLNFYLDENKFFVNNKCFIMTGEKLHFLTAFFNSSVFKYCFKNNFPELLGGTRELRKVFLEQLPVIQITEADNNEFMKLIRKRDSLMDTKLPTRTIDLEIDEKIFNLYGLTNQEKKEIGFIEIQ